MTQWGGIFPLTKGVDIPEGGLPIRRERTSPVIGVVTPSERVPGMCDIMMNDGVEPPNRVRYWGSWWQAEYDWEGRK